MNYIFKQFENKSAVISVATDMISEKLLLDCRANGQASLMLSGGSTPGPIYQNLAKRDLPWADIQVGLVDDRWVDEDDTGSNARLIRKTLLSDRAVNAQFFPMKTSHQSAHAAQKSLNEIYGNIVQPYSVTILGMGPDGHTASWFPEADGLSDALDPQNGQYVQSIIAKQSEVTGDYLERMTLTLAAVSKSSMALLLISGQTKLDVFESAASDANSEYPVRAVIDALGDRLTVFYSP
jgi:6-phosphogluconolactonase